MKKYLLITILFLTQTLALSTYAAEPTDPQCIKQLVNSDTASDSEEANTNSESNTVAESADSTPEAKTDIHQVYSKFKAYFEAVNETTLERDQVVYISQLALLAKEHVLLMGPPGTAKSQLAESILKAIHADKGNGYETSYYKIQMTPETTLSETHGPINYNELNQTGRQVRFYDEGMLKSHGVFIDEIFDSRANAKRNILGLINEREHAQGPNIEDGHIHTVIAATNKYLSEVYEEAGNDGPKALVDRFAFSVFIPGGLEYTGSILQIIKKAGKTKTTLPDLTYDDINLLREQINNIEIPDHVALFLELLSNNLKIQTEALEQASLKEYLEKKADGEHPAPPYRATKYHSARTTGKAAGILKAMVLLDWLESGGTRPLTVSLEDIKKLEAFYTLNGPSDEFLDETLSLTTNDHEKRQLMNIKQERKIFRKLYQKFADEINEAIVDFALTDLQTEMADENLSQDEKQELAKKLSALAIQSHISPTEMLRKNSISPKIIAKILAHSFATQALEELVGKDQAEASLNSAIAELEKAKEAALVKKQEFEKQVQEKVYELAKEKAKQNLMVDYQSNRPAEDQLTAIQDELQIPKYKVTDDKRINNLIRPQVINGDMYFIATKDKASTHQNPGSIVFKIDSNDKIDALKEANAKFTRSWDEIPVAINSNGHILTVDNGQLLSTFDQTGQEINSRIISKEPSAGKYLFYEPKHKHLFYYDTNDFSITRHGENGSKEIFQQNSQSWSIDRLNDTNNSDQVRIFATKDPNVVYMAILGHSHLFRIVFDPASSSYTMETGIENVVGSLFNLNQVSDDNETLYLLKLEGSKFIFTSVDLNKNTIVTNNIYPLYESMLHSPNLSNNLVAYNFWYNPETKRISFAHQRHAYVFDIQTQKFIVSEFPLNQSVRNRHTENFIEYRPNKFVWYAVDEGTGNFSLSNFELNQKSDDNFDTNDFELKTQQILESDGDALREQVLEQLKNPKSETTDNLESNDSSEGDELQKQNTVNAETNNQTPGSKGTTVPTWNESFTTTSNPYIYTSTNNIPSMDIIPAFESAIDSASLEWFPNGIQVSKQKGHSKTVTSIESSNFVPVDQMTDLLLAPAMNDKGDLIAFVKKDGLYIYSQHMQKLYHAKNIEREIFRSHSVEFDELSKISFIDSETIVFEFFVDGTTFYFPFTADYFSQNKVELTAYNSKTDIFQYQKQKIKNYIGNKDIMTNVIPLNQNKDFIYEGLAIDFKQERD